MVPGWMLERAAQRRLAGDWRGACAVAGIDADVDLRAVRRVHGAEVADRLEADLHHLVPDLLRWHLPRRRDGRLEPQRRYPLTFLPDAHALVARPPVWLNMPQRITLRIERLDYLPEELELRLDRRSTGRRDDTLVMLRDRWDSRCTPEALKRCGGVQRLPFFTRTGERLPEALIGGAGPEGLVERLVRLDDGGRPASAWAAAGFRLEVLLFDGRWDRERIDPAAFDPYAPTGTRNAARGEVVRRSLAWLRPIHPRLADAARRVREYHAERRRTAPWDESAWSGPPWVAEVDEDCGLFRIDVHGRTLVLDGLNGPAPRVRLVPSAPYGRADDARRRVEVEEFGVELARVPRIPHVLARRPPELTNPFDTHPLVYAALFPEASLQPAPAMATLRQSARVHCNGATHEVAMRGDGFKVPHTAEEVERERALAALGGRVQGCVAAADGWRDPAVRMPRPMRALRAELMALVDLGDGPAVAAALDRGLDPFVRDERGRTLLHRLPWLLGADLLPRLLAAGLPVDVRDLDGATPLHVAVDRGSPELVRALLAAGADRHARMNGDWGRMAMITNRPELAFIRDRT
ncbi:ankyrin repeat domain-containing protein [Dactylosporangium sp. CA-139066]|uniref:ankyrin repeat domain-containing protein n=1 Tax=Dactylosporangium sp. CA-139066 TaxID=3239930 RepID=UPI003D8E3EB4